MQIALLLLFSSIVSAEPSQAPRSEFITAGEIARGEAGYGLTVLSGDTIIRFPVTFVGSLENAMVDQDMVLIHLEGPPFDKTGIIQGMSGSPIYFQDRLLGALAYGWGFSKDPIAGVTPIAKMLALIDEQKFSPVPKGFVSVSAPLSVAGLPPGGGGEAWKRIEALGFLSAAGGRIDGPSLRLEPGSPIGVRLVDGDLSMTAIGTVTYVKDSAVIGFGHPFLNRGLSRMPMTGARIEAILPSQQISFKLGSATDDMGSILRDGGTGISGTMGATPPMIPFDVSLKTPWGGRDYHFRICRDDLLSASLMDVAWSMAAEAGLFTAGGAGIEVEVAVSAEGRTVNLRERGVVAGSILEMMPTVPIKLLYDNPFGRVHPDSVFIRVNVTDDRRVNEIIGVRMGQAVAAPGDTISLEVLFQTYDVGRNVRKIDVALPLSLKDGPLALSVTGGRGFSRPELSEPRSVNDLLDRINSYEARDVIVVSLSNGSRQLEVDGGILPSLPPSFRKLQSGAESSLGGPAYHFSTDAPIVGSAMATILIQRD